MSHLYDIIIPTGKDIRAAIIDYVLAKGWEAAAILGAVGSVQEMTFTTPVENELPLKTGSTPCHGAAEILSFTGEIMKREKMDPELESVYQDKSSPLFVHVHASCAIAGGHVCGGGLKSGKAFRELRVFLVPLKS
ncbi:MAG: PPC domain-containing DNA-binding protein [Lachnospiraceae bacterium]